MKKILYSLLLGCIVLFSCTYKYDALDLSNIRPLYSVQIPDSTETRWRGVAMKDYGFVFNSKYYYGEKWSHGLEVCDNKNEALYINVYDTFFLMTEHREYIPRCVFKYTSDILTISPAINKIVITPSEPYIIVPLDKDAIRYEYWLQSSSEKISELLKEMGYRYGYYDFYNLELDNSGTVLAEKQQKEVSFSKVGTSTVVSCIDVYGQKKSDGSDYRKIIEVRFPSIKITDLDKKHTQLTDANNPSITTFVNAKRYWLEFSCNQILPKLNELGYEISNSEYYIIERDDKGNILRNVAKPKSSSTDKWLFSDDNAYSVQACIDVSGWRVEKGYVNYNTETKVFTVLFDQLLLDDIKNKQIELTDANNPTITTFVNDKRYWLEFSCNEILPKLNELGYEISNSEYYIIERDDKGNVLRNVTAPKSSSTDKWLFSADNACSVQACIDVSGWKVDNGYVNYHTETKVFTVRFDQLLLDDIKNKQTKLTAADPHTYNIYVQGDNDIHVTGVSLNKTSTAIQVGSTTTLTATITPSNATNKSVSWTSSNTSVATVSSTGKVSGKSAGTATITCKTNDGGYTATCMVTVTGSGGGSSSTTTLWNFSDAVFNSLGTITSSKTVNGLTIAATSSKSVVIDSHNISYDGLLFTNRLKFGGTGASNARNVSFAVNGACTIEIYACSANSSENRTLKVDFGSFGSTNTYSYSLSGNVSKVSTTYTESTSKKVYIYSANSGINIYAIRITY